MAKDNLIFESGSAYAVAPGDSSSIPLDGVNVEGTVIKVIDRYKIIAPNLDRSIETNFSNSILWMYNRYEGGKQPTWPDSSWVDLFNFMPK